MHNISEPLGRGPFLARFPIRLLARRLWLREPDEPGLLWMEGQAIFRRDEACSAARKIRYRPAGGLWPEGTTGRYWAGHPLGNIGEFHVMRQSSRLGVVSGFGDEGRLQAVRPEPEVQSAPTLHARDEMGLQPAFIVKTGHHPPRVSLDAILNMVWVGGGGVRARCLPELRSIAIRVECLIRSEPAAHVLIEGSSGSVTPWRMPGRRGRATSARRSPSRSRPAHPPRRGASPRHPRLPPGSPGARPER
jgi:hypothetical protein